MLLLQQAKRAITNKIIELGFYTQFKHNLNKSEESKDPRIELFGVVNLALNNLNFKLIHSDMKHIHTLA